jgi:hypothetical protein
MMMFGAIPQFLYMRELFKRDYASKYYSSLPFALTMNLVELPYLVLVASLCIFCFYWSVGLNTGSSIDGFYFWLVFVVFVFFCHSIGVFVAYVPLHSPPYAILTSKMQCHVPACSSSYGASISVDGFLVLDGWRVHSSYQYASFLACK